MFTTFDTDVENIQKLGDQPNDTDGLSADELKYQFDKAGMDIKAFINNVMLIEIFDAVEAAAKGISQGSGIPGASLQSNSITADKLSKEEGNQAVSTETIQPQAVTLPKLSAQLQTLLENLQTSAQSLTRALDTKVNQSALGRAALTNLYSDLTGTPTIPTVDSALSETSQNAIQNAAVALALALKANIEDLAPVATSGAYSDLSGTPDIPVVDTELSTSSTNPVQNRLITTELNKKQSKAIATTVTLESGQTSWTKGNITGVTASNIVLTAPNPNSYAQWVDHRVRCSSQSNGSLGFVADSAITANITVNVVILG